MALRTEAVVEAVARGFDKVQRELRETGSAADKAGGQTDRAGAKGAGGLEKWQRAAVGMAAAAGAAYVAGKQLYQAIGEGAELELARNRFDALAGSIGTTGDALLGKFSEATSGMLSNAQMVDSASQIISTGLATNEEDVVRLATVVSELGLDMGQVILTFANNSKMRLDSLGLAVSDVEERTNELVAAGQDMDSAFDQAVLEGLEDRLELVGSAAETTAGQMRKLEADWANSMDHMKQSLASAFGPMIARMADLGDMSERIGRLEERRAISSMEAFRLQSKASSGNLALVEEELSAIEAKIAMGERHERQLMAQTDTEGKYIDVARRGIRASDEYSEGLAVLAAQGREAAQAQMELTRQMDAAFADEFLSNLDTATANSEDFNSVLFEQIAAVTDDTNVLAAAAVATGEYSYEQAAAAIKASIMAEKAAELAAKVAAGEMSVWEAVAALQAYQDEIDNTQGDYYIRFHFQTIGSMPTTTGPGTATGGIPIHEGTGGAQPPEFAGGTGGWRRVPGGMGQPFPVTLHGGEMFNVASAGQRGGGARYGPIIINAQGAERGVGNEIRREIGRELDRVARRADRRLRS